MKVRLAFAVAAFMEPEILLVDEVLAVGDATFQTKCIGKMSEVSRQGRTVIFVSHNMAAIEHLCQRVILLEAGQVRLDGEPDVAIAEYFKSISNFSAETSVADIPRKNGFLPIIQKVEFLDSQGAPVPAVISGDPLTVRIHYRHDQGLKRPAFRVHRRNAPGR